VPTRCRCKNNGGESFGQPPVTIFRGEGFLVELLFWIDGLVSFISTASAARSRLDGSSIHSRYRFTEHVRVSSAMVFGEVAFAEAELLKRVMSARSWLAHRSSMRRFIWNAPRSPSSCERTRSIQPDPSTTTTGHARSRSVLLPPHPPKDLPGSSDLHKKSGHELIGARSSPSSSVRLARRVLSARRRRYYLLFARRGSRAALRLRPKRTTAAELGDLLPVLAASAERRTSSDGVTQSRTRRCASSRALADGFRIEPGSSSSSPNGSRRRRRRTSSSGPFPDIARAALEEAQLHEAYDSTRWWLTSFVPIRCRCKNNGGESFGQPPVSPPQVTFVSPVLRSSAHTRDVMSRSSSSGRTVRTSHRTASSRCARAPGRARCAAPRRGPRRRRPRGKGDRRDLYRRVRAPPASDDTSITSIGVARRVRCSPAGRSPPSPPRAPAARQATSPPSRGTELVMGA